jgi:hypothetical protein
MLIDAVPVNPVAAPVKLVAEKAPVDGLNDNLVDATFAPEIEPVVALVNVK